MDERTSTWPGRLKRLRAKLGKLTQAQAAERLGVSLRSWQYWELGERVPHPIIQEAIRRLERGK
jgi:DNA-binding transcriptional regulator YiaG